MTTAADSPASLEAPAFAGAEAPPASLTTPAFAGPTHALGLELKSLEPAAYWVPTEVVRRWVKNPRDNEKAVPGLVAAIKRFGKGNHERGFGAPLLVRLEDGELIAGDTRIQAATALQMKRVPVRFMDLAAQEAWLFALADAPPSTANSAVSPSPPGSSSLRFTI